MANPELSSIEQYRATRSAIRELERSRQTAPSSLVGDLYADAETAAWQRLDALAQRTDVQTYMFAVASAVGKALPALEELQKAVDADLLPAERVDERRRELMSHPDMEFALEFAQRYGLLDNKEETTVKVEEPQPAGREERTLPKIRVTLLPENQVKINGRTIQASRNNPHQKDYGPARIALLKALARRKGELIDPYTLWKEAFGKKRPFDKDTMERARSWFRRYLTYNGKEIVTIHAGNRRGITARYGIVDFDAELKEIRPQDKYSFPDGHTIRGNLATLMKMLEKSSEEKPLTIEQISMGLYGTVDKSKRTSVRYDIASLKALVREKLGRELVSTFDPQHPFAKKTHYFLR